MIDSTVPTSTVDISRALTIDGWMSEGELRWLATQARRLSSGKVVEVGTYLGRSARALADNLDANSTLICVDPYVSFDDPHIHIDDGSPVSISGNNLQQRATDNILSGRSSRLDDYCRVIFIRKPSVEAALKFSDHSLDMVFIDGDHGYTSVMKDIDSWLRTIKPGGIICGHDFSTYDSVRQAVKDSFPYGRIKFPAGSIWAVEIPQ